VITGATGGYEMSAPMPGAYTIRATLPGFTTFEKAHVEVGTARVLPDEAARCRQFRTALIRRIFRRVRGNAAGKQRDKKQALAHRFALRMGGHAAGRLKHSADAKMWLVHSAHAGRRRRRDYLMLSVTVTCPSDLCAQQEWSGVGCRRKDRHRQRYPTLIEIEKQKGRAFRPGVLMTLQGRRTTISISTLISGL